MHDWMNESAHLAIVDYHPQILLNIIMISKDRISTHPGVILLKKFLEPMGVYPKEIGGSTLRRRH